MSFRVPNKYRMRTGFLASNDDVGNNGVFFIPTKPGAVPIKVIASDGEGWEHVSASLPNRTPTWAEMCWLKSLFWEAGDCVVQYHPPEPDYVNNHPYCLHLWAPVGVTLPRPPDWMVGVKELGVLT